MIYIIRILNKKLKNKNIDYKNNNKIFNFDFSYHRKRKILSNKNKKIQIFRYSFFLYL